jgi:molecular chaperone GrpE
MIRDKDSRRRDAGQQASEFDAEGGAATADPAEDPGPGEVELPDSGLLGDAGEETELVAALAQEKERYLRLVAEFDNFRKRTNREKLEMSSRAQAALAALLLDSLDDLSRVTALNVDGADPAPIVQGVDLIARKITKVLAGAGLESIDPLHQLFDPNLHDAVSTQPAENAEEDGSIAAVFQLGYLFSGQLLRPARVVVKKWNG